MGTKEIDISGRQHYLKTRAEFLLKVEEPILSLPRADESDSLTASSSASAFGRTFSRIMAECDFTDGHWQSVRVGPLRSLSLHPATHAIHYASACFEGMKAFRHADGGLRIFRMDRHINRLRATAHALHLPVPEIDTLDAMITAVVRQNAGTVPDEPGALYLRPTLFGTDVNVGAVTQPSMNAKLMLIASPVSEYFSAGSGTLCLHVVDDCQRAVPGIAAIKASANYASALAPIMKAREEHGADQVLFCPDGDVQETGTSNFFLMDDECLVTKPIDDTFLPGVTRDSLLRLSDDLGYEVIEENYSVDTMLGLVRDGEAALCGTAAMVTPVGTLIYKDRRYPVNHGRDHPNVDRLSEALADVQFGRAADRHAWLSVDVAATEAPRILSPP